jgi:hypothetical protein
LTENAEKNSVEQENVEKKAGKYRNR